LPDIDPQSHVEVTVTLRSGEKAKAEDVLGPAMMTEYAAKRFGAAQRTSRRARRF